MAVTEKIVSEADYGTLRKELFERLLSGQFPVGARFFSVREVAGWPGATNHLAQRALAELCREGYLESVPKRGLFVRSLNRAAAREEKPGEAKVLSLLIPAGATQSRVNDLLPIVGEALDGERWRMEVVYLRPEYADKGGLPFAEGLVSRRPGGIVWLMPSPSDMLLVKYLVSSGIPVVTYNRDFAAAGAMGVVADVGDAAEALFERVWETGKRRLVVFSVDRPSPSIQQFVGRVISVGAARGVEVRHRSLKYSDDFPRPEVLADVRAFLDGAEGVDGVLCAEAYSLLAVEHWLARRPEVRVPEDVAIASFDRLLPHPVVRVLPSIWRADMDHPRMIREAMDMISGELAGRRVEPKVRRVPATLIGPAGEVGQ